MIFYRYLLKIKKKTIFEVGVFRDGAKKWEEMKRCVKENEKSFLNNLYCLLYVFLNNYYH